MANRSIPRTIIELSQQLRTKQLSPVEVTQTILGRIAEFDIAFGAFITIMADSAVSSAKTAESEIARGQWRGPLHGVPIAIKDLIDMAGVRTTCASEMHGDRLSDADADVVRRLKEAGAIIIGKNNLHEFAYGGSSLVSYFGDMRNPWDVERITGGSSGGSAASVAAQLCYAAIGTDTAGSVREPAGLCGCVGLKPTFGRVSTRGVAPLSASLDHVGPLTQCAADAAIVLQTIAGYDKTDIGSCDEPVGDYVSSLKNNVKRLRVGVAREYFFDELDAEIESSVEDAISILKTLVAEIREIKLAVPGDRSLQAAESYAYHEKRIRETPQLYQAETLRRLRSGESVSAGEYIHRRRELKQARRSIQEIFADVELIVTPTTPMAAPLISELRASPDNLRPAELRLLHNTRPFNVWGLPAISLPCGFTRGGLPIGLQIAGPHWREDLVLRLAHAYEQATEWHNRQPDLRNLHNKS